MKYWDSLIYIWKYMSQKMGTIHLFKHDETVTKILHIYLITKTIQNFFQMYKEVNDKEMQTTKPLYYIFF